jgi:RNA polymerase-binding transcription factor DksA
MPDVTNESVIEIESTLNGVDTVLERLRLGTYRVCESCDAPIEDADLLANPLNTRCSMHLDLT